MSWFQPIDSLGDALAKYHTVNVDEGSGTRWAIVSLSSGRKGFEAEPFENGLAVKPFFSKDIEDFSVKVVRWVYQGILPTGSA